MRGKAEKRFEVSLVRWDLDTVLSIIEAEQNPVYQRLWETLFFTGLRIGEVITRYKNVGLRAEDFDVSRYNDGWIILRPRILKKYARPARAICPVCGKEWVYPVSVCTKCQAQTKIFNLTPEQVLETRDARRKEYRKEIVVALTPEIPISIRWGSWVLHLKLTGKKGFLFPLPYTTVYAKFKQLVKELEIYYEVEKDGRTVRVYPSPHFFRAMRAHYLHHLRGATWQDLLDYFGWSNPQYAVLYAGTEKAESLIRRGLG